MLKSDYLAIIAALVLTAFIYGVRIRKRSRSPLPPGPKKLPVLGNLFDLPTSHEWLTYAKLCKEYSMYEGFELSIQSLIQYSEGSNIIHLGALGLDFIILDSFDDAIELLEKRSSNYSDRSVVSRLFFGKFDMSYHDVSIPQFMMVNELYVPYSLIPMFF